MYIYIFTKTQKLGMSDRLLRQSAVYELKTVVCCIKGGGGGGGGPRSEKLET